MHRNGLVMHFENAHAQFTLNALISMLQFNLIFRCHFLCYQHRNSHFAYNFKPQSFRIIQYFIHLFRESYKLSKSPSVTQLICDRILCFKGNMVVKDILVDLFIYMSFKKCFTHTQEIFTTQQVKNNPYRLLMKQIFFHVLFINFLKL